MDNRYFEALEDCLSFMEQGEDAESCLARFPDLAVELRPVLETARLASTLKNEDVSNAAMQRSRTRILGEAANLRSKPKKSSFWRPSGRLPRLALVVLAFVLIVFLSWRGLLVASAKSLPGDPLYHFKRAAENVSMGIVPDGEAKLNIRAEINERRVEEVLALLGLGRVEPVQFEGIVTEQSPSRWLVDGVPVDLNPGTVITGKIETGMVVEVAGQTQPEGWVQADSIWLHSYELIGVVETISPTQWIISGVDVQVSNASQLDPAIRVGDKVIVLVEIENNQILHAEAILRLLQPSILERLEASPTPSSGNESTTSPQATLGSKDIEFSGQVGSISATEWEIDGKKVTITPDTKIEKKVSVGDQVKVHAKIDLNGTILALEIGLEAKQEDGEGVEKTEEPSDNGTDGTSIESGDSSKEDSGDTKAGESIDSGTDAGGETVDGSSGGSEDSGSDDGEEHIEPGDGSEGSHDPGGDESSEDVEPVDKPGGDPSGDGSDQKIAPTTEGNLINPGEYHSGIDSRMKFSQCSNVMARITWITFENTIET